VGEFLLVPAYPGSPGPTAFKRLCVCACACACVCVKVIIIMVVVVVYSHRSLFMLMLKVMCHLRHRTMNGPCPVTLLYIKVAVAHGDLSDVRAKF